MNNNRPGVNTRDKKLCDMAAGGSDEFLERHSDCFRVEVGRLFFLLADIASYSALYSDIAFHHKCYEMCITSLLHNFEKVLKYTDVE